MRKTVILVLAISMGGCSFWGGQERQKSFEAVSRGYEKAMEWSNFEAMASFIRPPEGAKPFDPSAYRDYKITGYKTRAGAGSVKAGAVVRQATIQYVWLPRMSEKTTTVKEVWEYSEKDSRWFLTAGIPEFR